MPPVTNNTNNNLWGTRYPVPNFSDSRTTPPRATTPASVTTPRVTVRDGFDRSFSANGRNFQSRDGVPLFNQGDREWGSRQLGTARGGTIANRGCAITATAMAVSAMTGRTITPTQMDQFLDRTRSYAGHSVMFERTGNVAGVTSTRQRGFGIEGINRELAAGRPVVIGVDYKNGRGTDHWMTVTGRNNDGTYNVNDPAGGRAIRMAVRNGALVSADANSTGSRGRPYRFDGNAVTFRG